MSVSSTRIRVSHSGRPEVSREIELVVDTGATLTKLPSDLLADLEGENGDRQLYFGHGSGRGAQRRFEANALTKKPETK